MLNQITLGIKSDPIETRYSFDWLFGIAASENIPYIQLGSFFELYVLDDRYFINLRELAARKNIGIKSVFTAHRELGGFFYEDAFMEKAARKSFERLIHVAGLLGADYCGSNPGAVYRDRMETKDGGIRKYLDHMQELMHLAFEKGLRGLTMEPMSSLAEPPTTPEEMDLMIGTLRDYHLANLRDTVPVYLCGDISHGLADVNRQICYNHMELFSHGIPYMAEFHLKNTDPVYNSTFGFSPEEIKRGIIDLQQVRKLIEDNRDRFPVRDLTAYLEIGGPKTGRDYSDPLLEKSIRESLRAIKQEFS